jgi:hypothetical protein
MTRAVRIREFGGPEVLRVEDVVVGEPGTGEAAAIWAAFEQIGKVVIV